MKEATVVIKLKESELDSIIATIEFINSYSSLELIPNKELLKDFKEMKLEINRRRYNGDTAMYDVESTPSQDCLSKV